MNKKWRGLMRLLEIQQIRNGMLIWQAANLHNILHLGGERFVLQSLFSGGSIPASYYVGLDARVTPASTDTLASLINEPTGHGYLRQAAGASSFTVALNQGIYEATSGIVSFVATSSDWGPVTNIFLSTTQDNTGVLIGTAALGQLVTVQAGDTVLMRIAMSLADAG